MNFEKCVLPVIKIVVVRSTGSNIVLKQNESKHCDNVTILGIPNKVFKKVFI